MTTRVPYEDVQAATTDIAQCAMNALTVSDLSEQSGVISMLQGVNGALQQRFVTLDLDTTRANQLPDDYDTDVESAWANPSEIVTVHSDCQFSLSVQICSRTAMTSRGKRSNEVAISTISDSSPTRSRSQPLEHCHY